MGIIVEDKTGRTSKAVYDATLGDPWGIVLHHSGELGFGAREDQTIDYLSFPHANPVSTHKYIRRNGAIVKIVFDRFRAYHAGYSRLNGRDDCNRCLGYEIANNGMGEKYTDAQYESVALSVAYDCALYRIPDNYVSSHHRVADEWVNAHPLQARLKGIRLGRKTDPVGWDYARMWRRIDQIRANWPKEFGIPLWFKAGPRIMST
jgi:N-acetyl-anhydromuramyl-L-alanine amidase AmpD